MLPLAEWAMRGRGQALGLLVILLITTPIIWPNSILAAAVLALVALRRGVKEGVSLYVWALLPALALLYWDNLLPLMLLSMSLLCALILRQTRSWSLVLMAISLSGLAIALLANTLAESSLAAFVEQMETLFQELQAQADSQQQEAYQAFMALISVEFLAGMLAAVLCISSFLSLVLARYWQAALYNPGGFQQEFHQLRLDKTWLVFSLAATALLLSFGKQYITWVWLVLFPVLVAGFALFHAVAKHKKLRKHWYVIFYIIVLLGDIPKMILVLFALADSFSDYRKKLSEQKTE